MVCVPFGWLGCRGCCPLLYYLIKGPFDLHQTFFIDLAKFRPLIPAGGEVGFHPLDFLILTQFLVEYTGSNKPEKCSRP